MAACELQNRAVLRRFVERIETDRRQQEQNDECII